MGMGEPGEEGGGFATPVIFTSSDDGSAATSRRYAECARRDDWRTSLMRLRDVTTRWLARDDA
eukprot:COSAG02_NODE_33476_length_499_cov_1.145000_1_plen_62_part_01